MTPLLAFIMLFTQTSCGTRFDLHGVDHEKIIEKQKLQKQEEPPQELATTEEKQTGCMKDSDCNDGKVCATVKGEYPGSCAGKGDDAVWIIGAALAGAAAAAAASNSGGGGGATNYAPSSAGDCWVNSYYNQYGTYVPGHYRSCPDDTRMNNYGRPSAGSTSLYDRDVDGDGIFNQYDHDDDNDGILDDYDY